jgi:acetyl esterase
VLCDHSIESYDTICRDIARQTGYAVVFPAYTLAPEAHYPTQQEQCYAAVKWVREHGHSKGLDQDKFAVVGDSAGGNVVFSVCPTIQFY